MIEKDRNTTENIYDTDDESETADAKPIERSEREFTTASTADGLPWIYQRNSITDGREKTVQLHLRQETIDGERDFVAAVEKELGESVNKADVREAAYLVAMDHVDEIADQLREWGYDA